MNDDSVDNAWTTAISKIEPDKIVTRGRDLASLIGKSSFAEMLLLLFGGKPPRAEAITMVDAMLVAVADHGISPSSIVSRYLASAGVPIQVAVAGGLLSFGDVHGGAGEEFARVLAHELSGEAAGSPVETVAKRIVQQFRDERKKVPGYGHPQHPPGDPRVPVLLAVAKETRVAGQYVNLAEAIEGALQSNLGRRVPMNIDGCVAAITLDLGLDWRCTRPMILVPRTVGLTAHVLEEWARESGWRHEPASRIRYDGPPCDQTSQGEPPGVAGHTPA